MSRNKHLDAFIAQFPFEGLTFDDVALVTRYADFLPDEASIDTRLTSRIRANIPFISAAMDTVTESKMAIAMAMLGGVGVIHKNLPVEVQAEQVDMVKRHLHGLIKDPVVFQISDTLDKVRATRREHGYGFSGFPILDDSGNLAGLLTSKDTKFARGTDTRIDSIMTSEVITAASGTSLQEAYDIMMKHKLGKLPLVEKGKLVGLYAFADVKNLIEDVQPLYNRDDKYRLRVAAAVSGGNHERVERLADAEVDIIVVDSAHGHSTGIIEMVRWLTQHYPDIDIIAGNVGTADGALALRDAGAHAVKVGIGPGSICTTRVVCGVGVPQITAVYHAAQALEGSIPVIADGGIRHSGDVPKALVAGADSVMLGSIMAGTEESPGEKIIHQGRQYVAYRGMGSLAAMRESEGSRERYSQAQTRQDDLVPQGIEGIVPYAGAVDKVMTQFCGGVRSSMGYCGCRTIEEMQSNGEFVRVSPAGLSESHPHDVKIMKEAPNYRS
ncbi:MAG: IMP dehydrogenase [Verrucomicrobia bacterium]|jgi:IMP dehydrogenase|nr:IMP dehydrogenase [Verrucomicrobiota bacterium]MBT7699210.1 IMP dehydrogenase [Verrucomicrobiota bacterium]